MKGDSNQRSPIQKTKSNNPCSSSDGDDDQFIDNLHESLTDDNSLPYENAALRSRANNASNSELRLPNFIKKKTEIPEDKALYVPLLIITIFVILFLVFFYHEPLNIKPQEKIEDIKKSFPSQQPELWKFVEASIREVKQFKRPMVLLLLYEDKNEVLVNNLIRKISHYASCNINSECKDQIFVPKEELLSPKARADYGYLIDRYKKELEVKGVMVVKNLEQIPGKVAQAFHSFCDEETPVIPKSLFIFTLKIDGKFKGNNYRVAENALKNAWHDMDRDIFDPLYTRLSGAVIKLISEHSNYIK